MQEILIRGKKELEKQNKFLTNNSGNIQFLEEAGIDQKTLLKIHNNSPDKASFLLESAFEIKFFAENGISGKTIMQIYDKDPNLAKLIIAEEDSITQLVKNNNISSEDLTKCNYQQMNNLINNKINPDEYKSLKRLDLTLA
ncbi:MAG: hypothetical protein RCG15_07165 [Candidatus Rickettsia vulgarisii]